MAIEAYDSGQLLGEGSINMQDNISHPDWHVYSNRLWASRWHQLFTGTTDRRKELTWTNRFASVLSSARHFYTDGEDVVANADIGVPGLLDAAGVVWDGNQAWSFQEMAKGIDGPLNVFAGVLPDVHAGWGFNPTHDTSILLGVQPIPPADADLLSDAELRTNALFQPFLAAGIGLGSRFPAYDGEELFRPLGDTDASAQAGQAVTQYKLLAEAIPALSFGAAANKLAILPVNRNIDMETLENGWPRSFGRWTHSDMKVIAYQFNWKLFDRIVMEGDLK